MSKLYAVSGKLSTGSMFFSVISAKDRNDVPNEIKKTLPPRVSVADFLAIDELHESICSLNSSKAVSIAYRNGELLTMSFVFQNIKKSLHADLINDLDAVIEKYRLL